MPERARARGAKTTTMAILLALAGCPDDAPPAEAEGGSSSSGGPGPTPGDDTAAIPAECVPGRVRPCYEGPFGTADVGRCRTGQQTCAADGSQWSACAGEVWPEPAEVCHTPEDDDCDGSTLCVPTLEWVQSNAGFVRSIAGTPTGGAVVWGYGGETTITTFVAALDADGQSLWDHVVDSDEFHEIYDLKVDADGDVIVVGRYEGSPDFGGGPLPSAVGIDAFAVRYAADGTYLMGHGLSPSGYTAAVGGPDGFTYVSGSTINMLVDDEPIQGTIFVAAIDPAGQLQWVVTGSGTVPSSDYWFEMDMTGEGEIALLVVLEGFAPLQIGGTTIELEQTQAVLLRLDTDGNVLGHSLVGEGPIYTGGRLHVHGRAEGVLAMSNLLARVELGFYPHVFLGRFGAAPEPTSEHLIGTDVWLRSADRYALGGTVIGVEFDGQLQLGSVGITGPSFPPSQAITVIDDEGRAQWAEVLYSDDYAQLQAVASSADGAVYVVGDVEGLASLAGETLSAPFIAKLRP